MNIRNVFVFFLYVGTTKSEVVNSYSSCTPHRFFYQGLGPSLVRYSEDIVIICQRFKNERRYVTLYDTKNRIPLFSALQLTHIDPESKRVNDGWLIEPNLAGIKGESMIGNQLKNFDLDNPYHAKYGKKQALDVDYRVDGEHVYDRGHLNPQMFNTKDDDSKYATNTLTNVAPQYKDFNQKTWKYMEEGLLQIPHVRCKFPGARIYVVVGVEPSNNNFIPEKPKRFRIKGNKSYKTKLSKNKYERVNVPEYYWTAICCDTSNALSLDDRRQGWSFAYKAANINAKNVKVVFHPVEKFLQNRYSRIFTDYNNNGNHVKACQFNKENAVTIIQDMAKKISGPIFDTNTLLKVV